MPDSLLPWEQPPRGDAETERLVSQAAAWAAGQFKETGRWPADEAIARQSGQSVNWINWWCVQRRAMTQLLIDNTFGQPATTGMAGLGEPAGQEG